MEILHWYLLVYLVTGILQRIMQVKQGIFAIFILHCNVGFYSEKRRKQWFLNPISFAERILHWNVGFVSEKRKQKWLLFPRTDTKYTGKSSALDEREIWSVRDRLSYIAM